MSTDTSSNFLENSQESLQEIAEISTIIQDLYKQLEQSLSNPNVTTAESDNIIKNIETLSNVKKILVENYVRTNKNAQQSTIAEEIAYNETQQAMRAIQLEIETSKNKIAMLDQDKYNRLRLIEINNYYGLQYKNSRRIIIFVICVSILFLITIILKNKGIISQKVFYYINIVVFVVAIIIFIGLLRNAYMRNNMNFEEYDFPFNYGAVVSDYPISTSSSSTSTSSSSSSNNYFGLQCVGSSCCGPNQYFDTSSNTCMNGTSPTSGSSTDSSSNGILYIVDSCNNSLIPF
jgi:hypothetical protein